MDGNWHKPDKLPVEKKSVTKKTTIPKPDKREPALPPEELTRDEKTEQERAEAAMEQYKTTPNGELKAFLQTLKKEHRWREVVVVVKEFYRRSPGMKNPSFGYTLANAYIHIGEMELALATGRENLPYVKLDERFARWAPMIKILMGCCHSKMGNLKEAVRLGEQAVAEDPSAHLHFYNLGTFYLLSRNYKRAQECAEKGREISGDRSQFNRLLLAASLALQRKRVQAVQLIDLTVRKTPPERLPVSSMDIARAYAACNDVENAAKYMEKYFAEFLKYQKKRNELKRAVLTDPAFALVLKNRKFASVIAIDESADDRKWEFGVVKEAQRKSSNEVKKIRTGRTKKKGRGQLPPVLAPKDWIVIRTKNYDLLSNSLPERLEELAFRLEAIMYKYRELFDAKDLKIERQTVKMFKNREEFGTYANKKKIDLENAEAYYSSRDKELVCYDRFSEGLGHKIFRIIYHEANHQFMFAYLKGPQPIWFAEGLACYFETAEYKWGKIVKVGDMNFERSNNVLNALRKGSFIPLKKLLTMDRDDFYRVNVLLNYAESWHFVHFLLNKNAATKKVFTNYLVTLRDTLDSKKAYEASFGKIALDQLENEFKNYVLKGK
jgi:tetratricopeptide (TPR) repeat protein